MMISKEDKVHYARNLEIGIILNLLLAIAFFLFFPKIELPERETPHYTEPIIKLVDIPSTQQAKEPASAPNKPEIIIPEDIIEIEVQDSFAVTNLNKSLSVNNKRGGVEPLNKGAYEFSSLPFIPRQIVEVVPGEIEGAKGIITFSLRIDNKGYVKEHKIIKNTSTKRECLDNVTNAVYKSRWQPITIDGEKIEYWIEKSYEFN